MMTTARLHLRRCQGSDVDAVLAYRTRPDVVSHLRSEMWTREKAEIELATYRDAGFAQPGDELVLLAETQGTAKVIGEVGLVWLRDRSDIAEVGYVFNPDFGGQGLATEAVAGMIHAAFNTFSFTQVIAKTDEGNASSRALCERIGMSPESVSDTAGDPPIRKCLYAVRDIDPARQGEGASRRPLASSEGSARP